MSATLIIIWENTYGCANYYRCATVLYLMQMLSQALSVIIEQGISATGHVRGVVYGINTIIHYPPPINVNSATAG